MLQNIINFFKTLFNKNAGSAEAEGGVAADGTVIPKKKESKLHHKYRLVVMNDDTFAEIVSYRLTRLNIYLLLSSISVLLVTIVTLVIFYTPVRQYVPGYGDYNVKQNIIALYEAVDSMDEVSKANDLYAQSVKMHLMDDTRDLDKASNYKLDTADSGADFSPSMIPAENDSLKALIEAEKSGKSTAEYRVSNVGNMFDPGSMNFTAPLTASERITAEFSPEKNHYGIDIADNTDTPVKAVLSGTVIQSTWTFNDGYVLTIMHKNNFVSFYKHNSKLLKKVGNFVKAGEAVAIIGNTGQHSDGPHLHFELWYNTQPVNPQTYIKF